MEAGDRPIGTDPDGPQGAVPSRDADRGDGEMPEADPAVPKDDPEVPQGGPDVPEADPDAEDVPASPPEDLETAEAPAEDAPAEDASVEDAPADGAPDPGPVASHAPDGPARRTGERTGLMRVLLGPGGHGGPRPHPYADEPMGAKEATLDAGRVAFFWFALASVLALGGYLLQVRYGYVSNEHALAPWWEELTLWPLFAGLALLGFGFVRRMWAKRLTMMGWVLFAAYWGLTARDLFVKEGSDYVNFTFALLGVYFFVWLAYHEWLSMDRRVDNQAVRFLNVVAFLAAGTYFLIDKIAPLRVGLINLVGSHTKWGLDLFGQGDKAGLQFIVDKSDTRGPVTFWYPETYCDPVGRGDKVGEWCAENGSPQVHTVPQPQGFWEELLFYSPSGESLLIVPVSIILACTAIQSIMLFVGLVAGTDASWKRKLVAAGIVAVVVYVLNLVRNVGIIWFYGQGHASFWVMHNAIGKGGSLLAMLGIAIVMFRYFPELLKSLFGVMDLKDRDGPVERALKLGRMRDDPPQIGDPRAEAHRERTRTPARASP